MVYNQFNTALGVEQSRLTAQCLTVYDSRRIWIVMAFAVARVDELEAVPDQICLLLLIDAWEAKVENR